MLLLSLLLLHLGFTSAGSLAARSSSGEVRPDYKFTIEPNFGHDFDQEWNEESWCPENEFATGFQQKTDAWCSGGGECTGLNSVRIVIIIMIIIIVVVVIIVLMPIIIVQIRMFCGLVGEPSYIAAAEPYYEVNTVLVKKVTWGDQ